MHRHNISCLVKVMWSTQRLLCVDIGFFLSACFMGSFSVEKVTFKTRMHYIYTVQAIGNITFTNSREFV